MRKRIIFGGVFLISLLNTSFSGFGQSGSANTNQGSEKYFPETDSELYINTTNPPHNSIQAQWDIRFQFDLESQTGLASPAGVYYINGKFLVSKWNGADTVSVFDSLGVFIENKKITGAGAIRSFTSDGTFLYSGINSNAVQVINPVTLTKVRQFTVPASVGTVRWITYNPTGNGGLGTFYVGNFGTNIFQIRKPVGSGTSTTVLNNIPLASHGLGGMYGMAYENNGPDSKYWVYCQTDPSGGASTAVIAELDSTGAQTGVTRDTNADLGTDAGLAGGLGLGSIPGYSGLTLYGVIQNGGSSILFGYERTAVGIKRKFITEGLFVFPNPAKSVLNVSWSKVPVSQIEVWNSVGQKVLVEQVGLSTTDHALKLDGFAPGVYRVVGYTTEGKKITQSFVKD